MTEMGIRNTYVRFGHGKLLPIFLRKRKRKAVKLGSPATNFCCRLKTFFSTINRFVYVL